MQLSGALIPTGTPQLEGVSSTNRSRFLLGFHRHLANGTAERLRRRGELMATFSGEPAGLAVPTTDRRCLPLLPQERLLSPRTLRRIEAERRGSMPASQSPVLEGRAPESGVPRLQWLRGRLLALLQQETVPCQPDEGSTTLALLELFERIVGEQYCEVAGTKIGLRVRSLARALSFARDDGDEGLALPLKSALRRRDHMVLWNRSPKVMVDLLAWRRAIEIAEGTKWPLSGYVLWQQRRIVAWQLGSKDTAI